MINTIKNIVALAMKIAIINAQFTDDKSSLHNEINIKLGNENFPTNVFNPVVSRCEIIPVCPAIYLNKNQNNTLIGCKD